MVGRGGKSVRVLGLRDGNFGIRGWLSVGLRSWCVIWLAWVEDGGGGGGEGRVCVFSFRA